MEKKVEEKEAKKEPLTIENITPSVEKKLTIVLEAWYIS